MGPSHLNIESARISVEAKKVTDSIERLFSQIESIDVQEYYGEEAMWLRLEKLANLIRAKLRSLGRRVEQ